MAALPGSDHEPVGSEFVGGGCGPSPHPRLRGEPRADRSGSGPTRKLSLLLCPIPGARRRRGTHLPSAISPCTGHAVRSAPPIPTTSLAARGCFAEWEKPQRFISSTTGRAGPRGAAMTQQPERQRARPHSSARTSGISSAVSDRTLPTAAGGAAEVHCVAPRFAPSTSLEEHAVANAHSPPAPFPLYAATVRRHWAEILGPTAAIAVRGLPRFPQQVGGHGLTFSVARGRFFGSWGRAVRARARPSRCSRAAAADRGRGRRSKAAR